MQTIALLFGGESPERDVSLRSAQSVKQGLLAHGHTVIEIDPINSLESYRSKIGTADVVFSVIHGQNGEDGILQEYLEQLQVPFVGSNSIASRLCFDKASYKKRIALHGLPTAESEVVNINTIWKHELVQKPFVLKPIRGGSSLDTFILRDTTNIDTGTINATLDKYGDMLLEKLIIGTEITVGVLDGQALPVIEIIPPKDVEFDYENKYNGATQELIPPVHVSLALQKQAQVLALKAHQVTGCRDISRTDMMIDEVGTIFILETNTMPGMTSQSLYPKQAAAAGYPMDVLCEKLIELARAH